MSTVAPTPDDPALLAALRSALQSDKASHASQPSQLRARLNRLLGDSTAIHRREIHLVVAALDENVPNELRASAPLSLADLNRHAEALAAARGWNREAGATAVRLWVTALDLELTGADPWPSSPSVGGSLEPGSSWPNNHPDRVPEESATTNAHADDAGSTVLPPRRDDPMATDIPVASSVVASVLPLDPTPRLAPADERASWPSSSRFAIAQALQREGFPVGAYYAFRGRNPRLRIAALAVFTLVASGLVLVPTAAVRTLLLSVAVLAVLVVPTKVVRNGTLVVDDLGFRWYAALPKNGPAELVASWADVSVIEGKQPRLTFPDGELWLKPRKGLLEAIRSRIPAAPRTTEEVRP